MKVGKHETLLSTQLCLTGIPVLTVNKGKGQFGSCKGYKNITQQLRQRRECGWQFHQQGN